MCQQTPGKHTFRFGNTFWRMRLWHNMTLLCLLLQLFPCVKANTVQLHEHPLTHFDAENTIQVVCTIALTFPSMLCSYTKQAVISPTAASQISVFQPIEGSGKSSGSFHIHNQLWLAQWLWFESAERWCWCQQLLRPDESPRVHAVPYHCHHRCRCCRRHHRLNPGADWRARHCYRWRYWSTIRAVQKTQHPPLPVARLMKETWPNIQMHEVFVCTGVLCEGKLLWNVATHAKT